MVKKHFLSFCIPRARCLNIVYRMKNVLSVQQQLPLLSLCWFDLFWCPADPGFPLQWESVSWQSWCPPVICGSASQCLTVSFAPDGASPFQVSALSSDRSCLWHKPRVLQEDLRGKWVVRSRGTASQRDNRKITDLSGRRRNTPVASTVTNGQLCSPGISSSASRSEAPPQQTVDRLPDAQSDTSPRQGHHLFSSTTRTTETFLQNEIHCYYTHIYINIDFQII